MRALVVVAMVGCGSHGQQPADGAGVDDGDDSVRTDVFVGSCAGLPGGLLPATCFDTPTDTVTFSNEGLNTDFDQRCAASSSAACIVVASTISVDGGLRPFGARPLVLWASSSIVVGAAGSIDASSHGGNLAAAADASECEITGANVDANSTPMLASGAEGGSYGSLGGDGGTARNGSNVLVNGRPHTTQPLGLRGGCAGGFGGEGVGGFGGPSGGAVYLMAGASIEVAGVIHANGAAGGRAAGAQTAMFGGGGGGSGGTIGLDAPSVVVSGRLLALGGSGGGGAGLFNGTLVIGGGDGQEPALSGTARAVGGTSSVPANQGGDGCGLDGSDAIAGGDVDASNAGGGGGGGGGAGRIAIFATTRDTTTAVIAPPPM